MKEKENGDNGLKSLINTSSSIMINFKAKAPGSYRHCQNVAQMGESIAKELDLDVEKFVVAATLHDIGKIFNPLYFIENQTGENIHDSLEPFVSYNFITRHVSDSVLILTQMGIPQDVVLMVSEHHGDTLLKSIYQKCKEPSSVTEDMYHYISQVPSSAESCLLMICDVVEATMKALFTADKMDDTRAIIDGRINYLIDNQQLDMLTIGKIRVIKKMLYREVESVYHKRIDYDEKIDEDKGD